MDHATGRQRGEAGRKRVLGVQPRQSRGWIEQLLRHVPDGEVSGLAGFRDNPANLQFSAPLQPGNSGGPLLDMRGRVVGITSASLVGRREPMQNVNFAVKADRAIAFLRAAGVTPALAGETLPARGAVEVGEIAERSVFLVRCEMGDAAP